MRSFRRLSLSLVLGVSLATAIGCNREAANSLRIGAALPLTGDTAYYGQDSKRGIDLAVDEINASGGVLGKRIDVIYEDTQGQGRVAVSAVRKLISADDVQVIIGAGTSTETLAVQPIVDENKRLLISPVSSSAAITKVGGAYVFRSVPSDGFQAVDLAHWILERGTKKVAVVFVNQSWGASLKDGFVQEFTAGHGEVLGVEASDLDQKDFRTILTSLKAKKADALVAFVYAKEGGQLLKQARELGISTQFFGGDPWTKQEFADAAGAAANGVLFTTPALYDGPEFQAFAQRYQAKYGAAPGIYESHGYDCAKLIAKAFTDAGNVTGPAVRAAMAAIRGYRGVTGDTTFDEHGDVTSKHFARMVWDAGAVHRVSTTESEKK